jgi:hypothetical protein
MTAGLTSETFSFKTTIPKDSRFTRLEKDIPNVWERVL